ncbi:benzoate/H(+) symporter BenE family transporter [Pigmentiphaga aceris]|uniref:benzoate/H(+) symporter BenE family transporter n=1 Tax=Pigmentiphaga aceris TaxID=1940612 RepID=UPI001FE61D43|nr:benzoate/H(+) symporter BenE family transporter [Pigmentiphaga aceris]
MFRSFWRDLSLPALSAGFVATLVGFTSSALIVFQAAASLGATPAQTTSWVLSLGIGLGLTCIVLSLRYRMPILTAWSTPGAAMMATGAVGTSMSDAIGAFIFVGLLAVLAGATGAFERLMSRIPRSLAAAMLAGVLLRFGMDIFVALQHQAALVLTMCAVYLIGRRMASRYVVIATLIAGLVVAYASGLIRFSDIHVLPSELVFTMPTFSWQVLLGLGLPLFIVTMTSQNVPGVAALHAHDYRPPLSPVIGAIGAVNAVLAPFGCYALNLAAITATLCMTENVDRDPARRYTASVCAGVFYLVMGAFAATIVAVFAALPRELVMAIAGLALLGTIGGSLSAAVIDDKQREPAIVSFLIAASGVSLWGIGAPFWALVGGLVVLAMLSWRPGRGAAKLV